MPSREALQITPIFNVSLVYPSFLLYPNRESLDDIHAKRARLTEAKKRGELDMDKIDEINQSISKKSSSSKSGRRVHEGEEVEDDSRRRRSDPDRSSRPSGRSRHRDDDADYTR